MININVNMANPIENWNWTEFCGSDFQIWSSDYENLSLCFQITCLRIPLLSFISIVSAYYSAAHLPRILRTNRELLVLNCRLLLTAFLAVLPVLRIVTLLYFSKPMLFYNYMLSALEPFTWILHLCFLLSLKQRLGPTLRGPVLLGSLWTMYIAVYLVNVRTYFLMYTKSFSLDLKIRLIFSCIEATLLVAYILTLLPSEDINFKRFPEDDQLFQRSGDDMRTQLLSEYQSFSGYVEPCYLGIATEGTTWISKLLFLWVNPLMKKGLYRSLKTPDDLFDLPEDLTSGALYRKLHTAMLKQQPTTDNTGDTTAGNQSVKVSLFKALHSSFGKEFYGVGILKFANDVTMFISPLFLNKLILFIEDTDQPMINGYFYASGIFITSLLGGIFNSQFTYQIEKVGMKLKGSLIAKIYQRLFLLSAAGRSNMSFGQIINYISTDIDRIVNATYSFHACWSIPFQIFVTLYLLYTQVGAACIAGVIFAFVLIPINKVIVNKIAKLSVNLMREKDGRVDIMTEIIKGIRVIKLNVWEQYFMDKIFGYRENELKYLKWRKYLDAICVYFWATTPVIISILTFATYVLIGGKLDAAVVFTSIALLNMLIIPLNAFPFVLNGLTEAWVSLKRVQKLFDTDELNAEKYYITMEEKEEEIELSFDYSDMVGGEFLHGRTTTAVYVKNGCFDWQSGHFKLRGINLNIQEGQLIGVYGSTGSGKSSLLAVILGEIHKTHGLVSVRNLEAGFGYVPQIPWLQQCSVRENILFGELFDPLKYRKVVEACALFEDFRTWPNRDMEIVGEGGATLSGGQKARISLARAVYKEKSVYLLDDVLSAVDTQVAEHIFDKCINGLLKRTTRIFVTHHQKFLMQADDVIVLKDGAIFKKGFPRVVFPNYVFKKETDNSNLRPVSENKFDNSKTCTAIQDFSDNAIENKEKSATGTVSFAVYYSYWKAVGSVLALVVVISVTLMQLSRNATDLWLTVWVSENASKDNNVIIVIIDKIFHIKLTATVYFYLTVYAIIGIVNSFITICRAYLFAFGGVRAAKRVHIALVNTIMKARVMFFDITPLGRILNRFSGDTYTVDDSLPFTLNFLLSQFFGLLGILFMAIYGIPWLCLFMAPLLPFYHWLQNHYRLTSRELKRLSSVTLSPLYCHFTETVCGLTTIRALKDVTRFRRENEDKLDASQKCKFNSIAASMWLSVRLYFISITIIGAVCVISILQCKFSIAHSAFVGLAFSYALSLVNILSYVINAFVETEQDMISMERICEYIEKPEVEPNEEGEMDTLVPFFWPSQGIIAFCNVSFKYRSDTKLSLKNLSFEILSGEKVGIVGRTGAGKSSLFVCLFRMAEITNGSITIDNVDIRRISLKKLRSQLVIIPQEPFLFTGTIRENIDPRNKFDDDRLYEVLTQCRLHELVTNLGGLDIVLKNGGSSLSVGERQLFCLARAVIRKAKIVCIDEATSNVDSETDRKIQEVIVKSFRFSTVLTIAHRTDTVMDCDRILVMGEGELLENNSPNVLLENPNSHFYRLVNHVPKRRR